MAVAASVVLIVGVTGLALTRGGGPGSAQLAAADLNAAIAAAQAPDAETRTVGATTEATVPDGFYLYGQDVPAPRPARSTGCGCGATGSRTTSASSCPRTGRSLSGSSWTASSTTSS